MLVGSITSSRESRSSLSRCDCVALICQTCNARLSDSGQEQILYHIFAPQFHTLTAHCCGPRQMRSPEHHKFHICMSIRVQQLNTFLIVHIEIESMALGVRLSLVGKSSDSIEMHLVCLYFIVLQLYLFGRTEVNFILDDP